MLDTRSTFNELCVWVKVLTDLKQISHEKGQVRFSTPKNERKINQRFHAPWAQFSASENQGCLPAHPHWQYLSAVAPFLLQEELLLKLVVGVVLVPGLEELEPADTKGAVDISTRRAWRQRWRGGGCAPAGSWAPQ